MTSILHLSALVTLAFATVSGATVSKSAVERTNIDPVDQALNAYEQCNERPEVKDGDFNAVIDCAEEYSARLDDVMAVKYRALSKLLPKAKRLKLDKSQRDWANTREKQCTPKGKIAMDEVLQIDDCIIAKSITRIEWLDRRIAQAKRDRRARR